MIHSVGYTVATVLHSCHVLTTDILCLLFLQNDKRYLNLEPVADERKKILLSYIEELEKKGVPPPPTASEPSRRNVK